MSGTLNETRPSRDRIGTNIADRVRGGEANVAVLALFAFAALSTGLVSLVTLNRVKDIVVGIVLRGGSASPIYLLRSLEPVDAGLAGMAVLSVGLLVWMEIRRYALRRFLQSSTPIEAFVALTILSAWTGHSYLSPGVLLGGDTATHISRFLEVAQGLDTGSLPTWTNNQYLGAPLLWFTGPLTYVVGGVIAALTGDAVTALKIFLFSCHIAAAWLFFGYMRHLKFRPVPAMVAAAGFVGCFAHLHLFLFRGVVPQAATILFLVLLFDAAEGLMVRRGRIWVDWLAVALATAGLIVNHQPHALFAAFYLAVFGTVSLLLGRWRWSALPSLVFAALCGLTIAAIAIFPIMVESDWVMIQPEGGLFFWHVPTLARIGNLLLWRDTRTTWGFDYWAYLGITLIVLGAIGAWGGLRGHMGRERRSLAIATCVCLAFSLFLFNPVVRDIIFVVFLLAILVAIGVEKLEQTGRWADRAVLLATALVFLDICSTSIQPVARTDKGFAIEAGRTLARLAPNERMIEMSIAGDGTPSVDVGPDSGPEHYYAAVQRIAGNHNMAATRVHNYIVAAAKLAEADLRRDRSLASETRRLLALLNVTRIICLSPIASGCRTAFADTTTEDGLGSDIRIDGFPVLFSRTLVELSPPAALDKPMLWEAEFSAAASAPRIAQIDRFLHTFTDIERSEANDHIGAAIAIRTSPTFPDRIQADGDWQPRVTDYKVGLEHVDIEIDSNGPGYAQIAHPWFPATQILVDGHLIAPIQGAINLMLIPVHTGRNHVEIQPGTTPVRQLSELLSLAGLILTAGVAIYLRRVHRAG
ncbi:MAG: hypothetical protein QOG73_1742 [Acetobacteraceae bacterium]|nr:hypothetical protein [Acetobacteraceae bacterium]